MIAKTRIAPTPSGFLHIGNACNFLLIYCFAKINNAKILLRIDDIDYLRCKDEYLNDIFEIIDWLGIAIDEGPSDINDFKNNWSQQLRFVNYNESFQQIFSKCNNISQCSCTRKMKRNRICNCNSTNLSQSYNQVFKTNETIHVKLNNMYGDPYFYDIKLMNGLVLLNKKYIPSYQICSLHDDIKFGITHIIRGKDLLPSSAIQLYLSQYLNENNFNKIQWFHHELIIGENNKKISKSLGDMAMKSLIQQGFTISELIKTVSQLLQLEQLKHFSKEELIDKMYEKR